MKIIKRFNAHYDEARISEYATYFNLDKKIIEILFSRGIYEKEDIQKFLNPSMDDFNDPFLLSGMKEGVERIQKAISNRERILIFGDYDVDGICATAILLKTLNKFGVHANYYLPNRFIDGYGLTNETVDKVVKMFHPSLIITVDCGITCVEEVEYIKSLGVDVIVSDHHDLDLTLPKTTCINPKIQEQEYPFHSLCGAGVAYKISQALLKDKCDDELLAICALATIADIVPLLEENRAIVHFGLKCANSLPKGIKAMLKENKLEISKLNATDLSFKISPKLNASGRMGEASDSLKLFLENDPNKIKGLIETINNHNKLRQELCSSMYDDCMKMLEDKKLCDTKCIILSSPNWDSGILGIIAARLVEKFHRPAFLFAESDGVLKGSGRSVDDINIHDILMSSGDLLTTFGGHSMAAGLTLKKENLNLFIERVNKFIDENVNDKIFNSVNYYDVDIEENMITNSFVDQVNKLEPYGCSNPKPCFRITADNCSIQPLKNFKNHANFCFKNNLKLISFNYLDKINYINYSKNYNLIFEFQPSFYKKEIKGLVKYFDFSNIPSKSIEQSLNGVTLSQFIPAKLPQSKTFTYYRKRDLTSLVLDCSKSAFGTLFVSYNYKNYIDFISNYETNMIEQFYLFNLENNGGFNSCVLAPQSTKFFQNFERIIFLDALVDGTFLEDASITSNIYLPSEEKATIKYLSKLDTTREKFAEIFGALKALVSSNFSTDQKLHNEVQRFIKHKIPFEELTFILIVFTELEIIKKISDELGFHYEILDNKSALNNSTIYNKISLLQKVGGKK